MFLLLVLIIMSFGSVIIPILAGLAVLAQLAVTIMAVIIADKYKIKHTYNNQGLVTALNPDRTAINVGIGIQWGIFGVMMLIFLIAYYRSDIGTVLSDTGKTLKTA